MIVCVWAHILLQGSFGCLSINHYFQNNTSLVDLCLKKNLDHGRQSKPWMACPRNCLCLQSFERSNPIPAQTVLLLKMIPLKMCYNPKTFKNIQAAVALCAYGHPHCRFHSLLRSALSTHFLPIISTKQQFKCEPNLILPQSKQTPNTQR